jgi:Zn-dependent protease with chaperone function
MSYVAYRYIRFARRLEPFDSAELDELAGRMGVLGKLNRRQRYFFARSRYSAFSFPGGVAYGKAYWNSLDAGERIAIGAHEFSHMRNDDVRKRQVRILLPGLAIMIILASVWIYYILPYMADSVLLAAVGLVSLVLALSGSLLLLGALNAPWRRRTELNCDIEAARYADGEDLISALELWEGGVSQKARRKMRYRVQSSFYPSLSQRVEAIRKASMTTGGGSELRAS